MAVVEDGVVRGVLAGTTAVWAESESGLQSNACTVTVGRDAAEPTAIALENNAGGKNADTHPIAFKCIVKEGY